VTDSTGGSTPGAGWFPDPAGSHNLRWWDGAGWTENFIDPDTGAPPVLEAAPPEPAAVEPESVAPAPVEPAPVEPEAEPVTPAADPEQPLTRRQLREQLRAEESAPPPIPMAVASAAAEPVAAAPFAPAAPGFESDRPWVSAPPPQLADAYPIEAEPTYVPMGRHQPRETAAQEVLIGSASTPAVWIFAALPVLHAVLIWLVYNGSSAPTSMWVRLVVLLGPIIVYLILARIDRQALLSNGHPRVAPTALAIVPPLFLGIRVARVGIAGLAPLVTWLVLQGVVAVFLVALAPSTFAALTASNSSDSSAQPTATASVTPHVLSADERAQQLTQAGMAATLTSDFASQGITFTSVACPPIPAAGDGVEVTCVGTMDSTTLNIVVSIDSADPTAAFDIVSSLPGK
jgi:hypothetical protein